MITIMGDNALAAAEWLPRLGQEMSLPRLRQEMSLSDV